MGCRRCTVEEGPYSKEDYEKECPSNHTFRPITRSLPKALSVQLPPSNKTNENITSPNNTLTAICGVSFNLHELDHHTNNIRQITALYIFILRFLNLSSATKDVENIVFASICHSSLYLASQYLHNKTGVVGVLESRLIGHQGSGNTVVSRALHKINKMHQYDCKQTADGARDPLVARNLATSMPVSYGPASWCHNVTSLVRQDLHT